MLSRSPHRRHRARGIAAAVVAVLLVVLMGCGGGSGTSELADDPADVTIAGPRPTAPALSDGPDAAGGANSLIRSVDALAKETDLCVIVTGEGLTDILAEKPNVAGLASNPAGLAQLVVAVDKVFLHGAEIAPADMQPSMSLLQRTWRRVATIDSNAVDAQAQIDAIFTEPDVVAATQSILTWAALNCELPDPTTTTSTATG